MLAAIFVHDDTPTNWKHGHIPLHNNFGSLCFRNPALLCLVQNHFQAHSMPRMAFFQEGKDDEDMSSIGMTTIGEWHRDPRDQHGYPNRDGGPKLIRFESPRRRPKSSLSSSRSPRATRTKINAQVAYRVCFGCSLYGWKDNLKVLPMELVSGPNSFGFDRNHRNNKTSRICHSAATPSFGLLAQVSSWGPLWTWLWGYARPNHHIISNCRHIRVKVLFSSSFPRETEIDSL